MLKTDLLINPHMPGISNTALFTCFRQFDVVCKPSEFLQISIVKCNFNHVYA